MEQTKENFEKIYKMMKEQKINLESSRTTTWTFSQHLFGGVSLAPEIDDLFKPEDNSSLST